MSISLIRLTHWSRVTHICVSKLTVSGSDNGIACRLNGTETLSEPTLESCDHWRQISVKTQLNFIQFPSRRYTWKWRLKNDGYLVSAPIMLMKSWRTHTSRTNRLLVLCIDCQGISTKGHWYTALMVYLLLAGKNWTINRSGRWNETPWYLYDVTLLDSQMDSDYTQCSWTPSYPFAAYCWWNWPMFGSHVAFVQACLPNFD